MKTITQAMMEEAERFPPMMTTTAPKTLVKNTSGVRALGHAVLVEPYEPEIRSSVIVIPDTVGDRTKMAETRAIVIAVGPCAWDDEPEPRAKPGDKVLIVRYAGVVVRGTADGKFYRMINDRDIFCQIEIEEAAK